MVIATVLLLCVLTETTWRLLWQAEALKATNKTKLNRTATYVCLRSCYLNPLTLTYRNKTSRFTLTHAFLWRAGLKLDILISLDPLWLFYMSAEKSFCTSSEKKVANVSCCHPAVPALIQTIVWSAGWTRVYILVANKETASYISHDGTIMHRTHFHD